MTAFEIISIFIGILALLIAFGSFVIACLSRQEEQAEINKPTLYLVGQVGL